MSIDEVNASIVKRAKGQCEWIDTVRDGFTFTKVRCCERNGEKARNYRGTVHLQINYKSASTKEIEKNKWLLCWKHTIANDKIIKKPPRKLKKKKDPDQINILELI